MTRVSQAASAAVDHAAVTPEVIARLWAKVDRRAPDECWEYGDGRTYGRIQVGSLSVLVHRVVETIARGPLSPGQVVRHSCDNPPCCNPDHLLRGTQKDNMQDCVARGRFRQNPCPGEANGLSKLTDAKVIAMRERYVTAKGGITTRALADEFGVARSLACRIVNGTAWRHLPMPERVGVYGRGLCACGCGGHVSIAKKTNSRLGHVAGQPVRYLRGHA